MRNTRKLKRGTCTALLAILAGISAVALPMAASANFTNVSALLASNVPIIQVPPTTTPIEGTGGTTTSPDPVNPDPGPPENTPAPVAGESSPMEEATALRKGGDDLYVYIVLQKDYKEGARLAKATPGVIGKPWRAVRSMEKRSFHFPLMSVAAGNEYYVVGIRKVGKKLEYTSKHPVRVERD